MSDRESGRARGGNSDATGDVADVASAPTPALGVVLQGTGGVWRVRTDAGDAVDASLRGRLKQEGQGDARAPKLAVGDRVRLARDATGAWAIEEILPRHGKLSRREPGGRHGERVLVANVDQVLVVFAAANPEPHPRMLDRFLVIAEANGLAARIVINKVDLVAEDAVRARFAAHLAAGYPLHCTSTVTGVGLDALAAVLGGHLSALAGPSGVGKSSLMNAMFPGLLLRTGEISRTVNKGRHTTVGAMLHPLPGGGFIADTPGLREVGLWGIAPSELAHCFPEFRPLLGHCRFADCTHRAEPSCAVRERGGPRYDSYLRLLEELSPARG